MKPNRPITAWMRGAAVAAILGMLTVELSGCWEDDSPAAPCLFVDSAGRCVQTPPTPPPCDLSLCPFTLSWTFPFPSTPTVALVHAVPPGPFQLQVNGTFPGFPDGLALVTVGDFITGNRCGCSTIQYIVR